MHIRKPGESEDNAFEKEPEQQLLSNHILYDNVTTDVNRNREIKWKN